MMVFGIFLGCFLLVGLIYIQLDTFGGRYTPEVKKRIKASPNFSKGQFQNLQHTPNFGKGVSVFDILKKQFRHKDKNIRPQHPIPTVPIDWNNIPEESAIWLGHSSLFLKTQGLQILVDPVRTTFASPMKGMNRSFQIEPEWDFDGLDSLNYVFITHDHYDHLDRQTIKSLRHLNATYICGIGVGMHLKRWGVPVIKIIEMDWWEHIDLTPKLRIHFLPTRHFSGRKWFRNNTLWGSFMLESSDATIFLGGDSGYGDHFKTIADKFPNIDLAFLELGQYSPFWPYIHMNPDDFEKAVHDLKISKVWPVHHSIFALAHHPWFEPHKTISEKSTNWEDIQLYLSQIGQPIQFMEKAPEIVSWWEGI